MITKECYLRKLEITRGFNAPCIVLIIGKVLVNKQDLKNYGITWKDCVRLHIGGIETVNVLMWKFETPEQAAFHWNELNAEHHRNSRGTRCIVPGKQKPFIVCPECNKCSNCPFGRKPEDRQPRVIIYNDPTELDNDGYTDDVDVKLDLEIITKEIKRKNQLIAEVFSLCIAYGYSISEIAGKLKMPERKVRYLMDQAKEIAKKMLD